MARLFYKQRDKLKFDDNAVDNISFTFVSDELNGINRDLQNPYDASLPIADQPGLVRTRVNRHYSSLWKAIFENAISRIYLGVHWHFDAFAASDVVKSVDGDTGKIAYKEAADITYSNVWEEAGPKRTGLPTGGVPLGLGIANEIWSNGMQEAAPGAQAGAEADQAPAAQYEQLLKASNTAIR